MHPPYAAIEGGDSKCGHQSYNSFMISIWMNRRLAVVLAVITLAAGCQQAWIFSANFDADPVGAPPPASPPGDPPGDAIAYTGAVSVINSPAAGSNAALVDRGSTPTATTIDMIASGGPHTCGTYRVSWRAHTEAYLAPLTISLLSSSGKIAFQATFQHAQYRFTTGSGSETVGPLLALNAPHTFTITVDMATKTMIINLNGVAMPLRPFVNTDFEDLKRLRFEYAAAVLEANAGKYVIDVATMRK